MNYNLNISSDIMKVDEIISNFYWYISFTLTVKAVNDAPVLLQPLEGLNIIEYSEAAAVVFATKFGTMDH